MRPTARLAVLSLPLLAAGCLARATPSGKAPSQEGAVIDEINLARRDPEGYARLLEEVLPQFDGLVWRLPGKVPLMTREGAAPVREAIARLRRTRPMAPLSADKDLAHAARDHARDVGASGTASHTGSDGSTPRDRVARYARVRGVAREAIAIGPGGARLIVAGLLIDDGVPDRGHREALLDPRLRLAGVAAAPYADDAVVCVIDLAQALD